MSLPAANGYPALLARVKKTLLEGQRRIEQEKVKTYWETGRVIHTDILQHKNRAKYGAEVVNRLSNDLNIEVSTLKRCIQFAKTYPRLPKGGARHQFSWTHYRKLITVSDGKKRAVLEKAALKNSWTTNELAEKIKNSRPLSVIRNPRKTESRLPAPNKGSLYTYTTAAPSEVFAITGEVMADLGFDTRRLVKKKDWPGAKFQAKSDYTYRAYIEKVIDGDTLWAQIDLGFKTFTRQKLRLKGIDAPELSTAAGQRAKAFVYLKKEYGQEKTKDELRRCALRANIAANRLEGDIKKILLSTYCIFYPQVSSVAHAEAPLNFIYCKNEKLHLKRWSRGKTTKLSLQATTIFTLVGIESLSKLLQIDIGEDIQSIITRLFSLLRRE